MSLILLALPPISTGSDPITERTLRAIVGEPVWEQQIEMWRRLHTRGAA